MARILPLLLGGLVVLVATLPAHAASTRRIMSDYARWAVDSGQTVGIGVAVIEGDKPAKFVTFGQAVAPTDATPGQRFSAKTLFGIGSVTKVFTTNLLGQAVSDGSLSLDTPLSAFRTQLGPLSGRMANVTLGELGDFTGGITDYAPLCSTPDAPPGCLPSSRPTIGRYGGRDFALYFANTQPMNYNVDPPAPTRLPAPYFYSDFGLGLLGLLLADNDTAMSNRDVRGWYGQVRKRILRPLGMRNTYLFVPDRAAGRVAGGYDPAIATAEVSGGAIQEIKLVARGGGFAEPPRVVIEGGGGQGALAEAHLSGEAVDHVTVTQPGSGYVAPARVFFSNGGATTEAAAHPIVRDGKVVAIAVSGGGAGYQRVPDVTVVDGRIGGVAATATAHLFDGRVAYVTMNTPGSGYVDPLTVRIEPGRAIENAVPVWAPAGALSTDLKDMAKFARAALAPRAGFGDPVGDGFRVAEQAYACTGPDPALAACPRLASRSALAWAIQPKDKSTGLPKIISKNGSLGGVTTQVYLVPKLKLAVVVFANSRSTEIDTGLSTGVAPHVAGNILYALIARETSRR